VLKDMSKFDSLKSKLKYTWSTKKRINLWKEYIDNEETINIYGDPLMVMSNEVQAGKEILSYLEEKITKESRNQDNLVRGRTKYCIELGDSIYHQFIMLGAELGISISNKVIISDNIFIILDDEYQYSALIIDLDYGRVSVKKVSKEDYINFYPETKIIDNTLPFGMINLIKHAADQWTHSTPFLGNSVCDSLRNEASHAIVSYGMSLLLSAEQMVVFKHDKKITYEKAMREILENSPEPDKSINSTKFDNFLEFIKAYSHSDLIDIFINEYHKLKGSSNLVPYTGKSGGIEFVGAILLWKFANESLIANKSELDKYGPLIIGLADVLGLAFNSLDPLPWSERMDVVINTSSDVLIYSEWSEVYRYLDSNFSAYINDLEFAQSKQFEERRIIDRRFEVFSPIYDSLPNFESVIDYYASQGLGFKRDIWFNITN